jgi:hypothetical protein
MSRPAPHGLVHGSVGQCADRARDRKDALALRLWEAAELRRNAAARTAAGEVQSRRTRRGRLGSEASHLTRRPRRRALPL